MIAAMAKSLISASPSMRSRRPDGNGTIVVAIGPKPACSGLLQAGISLQEPLDRLHAAGRILLLRRVTEIVEEDQLAACDLAPEAPGIVGRDEAITPAPEDQGRQRQLPDALI